MIEMTSRATLQAFNPNVFILSGSSYLAITSIKKIFTNTIFGAISASMFPIALGLFLPTFMFSIIYEKEKRIVDMMKIHGLRSEVYWITNICFNLLVYFSVIIIFLFMGRNFFEIPLFSETSLSVLVIY